MTGDGALGSYGLRDGSVIRLIPLSGFEETTAGGADEEEGETDAPAGVLEASMSSRCSASQIGIWSAYTSSESWSVGSGSRENPSGTEFSLPGL